MEAFQRFYVIQHHFSTLYSGLLRTICTLSASKCPTHTFTNMQDILAVAPIPNCPYYIAWHRFGDCFLIHSITGVMSHAFLVCHPNHELLDHAWIKNSTLYIVSTSNFSTFVAWKISYCNKLGLKCTRHKIVDIDTDDSMVLLDDAPVGWAVNMPQEDLIKIAVKRHSMASLEKSSTMLGTTRYITIQPLS